MMQVEISRHRADASRKRYIRAGTLSSIKLCEHEDMHVASETEVFGSKTIICA